MLLAIDTETELITAEDQAPRVVCVQLATHEGATILHHSEALPYLAAILANDDIHIVGAWVAYDFCCIIRTWPELSAAVFRAYERDRIQDVAINNMLHDIASKGFVKKTGYGLGDMAKHYAGYHLNKDDPWRVRYGELRDYPLHVWPEGAKHYAIEDARATWLTAVRLEEKATSLMLQDRWRQARASLALKFAANRGLRVDPVAVAAFETGLRDRRNELQTALLQAGFLRRKKDGTYSRCMKIARYHAEQITGQASLSKDSIEDCGDPLLEMFSAYQSLDKKLSTDVPLLKATDANGKVHSRFEVLKATGRTGSRRPNVQNLDTSSGIRECFTPSDGFVLALGDYGKGELCTWSQVCLWVLGFSRMAQALNAGRDPHLEIAAEIRGLSYGDALAHKKELYSERQTGKVCNFGLPGGMGIQRFIGYAKKQYGVILDEPLARRLKTLWLNKWEGPQYFQWIHSLLGGAKRITIKQFVSERYRANVGYCDCANGFFQALLADAAKDAGFYLCKEMYSVPSSPLYGSHPVNFVHDEWISEVPEADASAAAIRQAEIMRERAAAYIPDVTPEVEPLLARRWSKKAEPVWQGKELVPWE